MKYLWWHRLGRSGAYMCFIISLIWLLWLMGNPWGENWSLLTDSKEYTLPELTSFSSSPFNPTSSTEPQVVMRLLLKQPCGSGIWSHSSHCRTLKWSVRLAQHQMSALCIQVSNLIVLLVLFKKPFERIEWYMSFDGIASIDNLFSTDDLHLIYSPPHVSSVPVTVTASPAVRSQTVPLHHVLIQSIRKINAALSARMVSFFRI